MELKILTNKAKEELRKRSVHSRKWIAWTSASFGRNLTSYQRSVWHPEDYKEGAQTVFAEMVMRDFKELVKLDRDAAEMIYETYRNDLWQMVEKTFNEEPWDYFRFYYKKGNAG